MHCPFKAPVRVQLNCNTVSEGKARRGGDNDTPPQARPLGCASNNIYMEKTIYKIGKKFRKAMKEYGLIDDGDKVLIGLSGGKESSELRRKLSAEINIPARISANMLLDVLNRLYTYDELVEIVQSIKE